MIPHEEISFLTTTLAGNNGEDKYINEYFLKNKVNANISKMI